MNNRFVWNDGDVIMPACAMCKHKRKAATCAAYPDGIPEAILTGEHDHTEPYKGDNGIQFEVIEETKQNK